MSAVRELELDLDAFEGPFDLLLTLVLKEELEPADLDLAAVVVAFVDRLTERDQLDLEACGEFLVLIAALLELKARALFPDEQAELAELEPEEAAEELARRLAEYRRMKEAAGWLSERLAAERDRFFRLGPAPLAPRPQRRLARQDPARLASALRALAEPPPQLQLAHMGLRFPPVSQFLARFRAVLTRRRRFDFDAEVASLSRVEQAVAFLALLELRKTEEVALEQAAPFAPIRVSARPWPAAAPTGRGPAPPPPDAAAGAPAGGPYVRTVPPASAPAATSQERAEPRPWAAAAPTGRGPAPTGRGPAPPPPDAAAGAPAGGPYVRTVPPASARAASQERAEESAAPDSNESEGTWTVRSA